MAGYKDAADEIVRIAIKTGKPGKLDTYVFPAIFLYRQFLELALKDIYLSFSDDDEDEKSKMIKNSKHDLIKIWDRIKPLISDDDPANIEGAESYLRQFADEDKGSFAYRYPIDKKLDFVHVKKKQINLLILAERMNEIAIYLECVSTELCERRKMISEMRHYGMI